MDAYIEFRNVVKKFDDFVALDHVSLQIPKGAFVTLLGPSGCGKTTLMRQLAGFSEPEEGDVLVDGKRMNGLPPFKRNTPLVFQEYALFPHMTVYENMAFALKLRKMPKDEIDKRVKWAAEVLDITQYLERKPKALSGGQRQRVAIGRAIVREPKVFLMDEPLSNLDAKLRNQMRAEIIKLRQSVDTTFIYVTHDQTEAMTLGDRIVIMRDGWIMQIGTPQEVFDHPANVFVAGFIGMPQMNFFDAELVKTGDVYSLKCNGAEMALSQRIQDALKAKGCDSRKIILGCRPEHMVMKSASGADTMEATVDVSEMMGSEIHLHVSCHDKDVVVRIPTTELDASQRGGLQYGTKIAISFPADLVHLFDPETEENLL